MSTTTDPRDQDTELTSPTSPRSTIPTTPGLEAQEPPFTISRRKSKKHELPPLPFHLREHRFAVFTIAFILFIDHGVLPPALYFSLAYCTNLSHTTIFAIVTSVFGIVLGAECCYRTYKLLMKDPKYRPENACKTRWKVWTAFDYMQSTFPIMLIINVIFVVVGTSITPPVMRLLALPMPLIIFNLSWQLLLSYALRAQSVRTPFRISSTEAGQLFPMYMFVIIEDFVAVDFNGKLEWRQAWMARYNSSFVMRDLVKRLTLFWGIGGMIMAAVTLVLLFVIDGRTGEEVGYALGWLLPWAWIIPSVMVTTVWVKAALIHEEKMYEEKPELFVSQPVAVHH